MKTNNDAVLEKMISIYCRSKHDKRPPLCASCRELLVYSRERLEKCPHGIKKHSCSDCLIHCYETDRREKIRQIMRYSGPRMIYKNPIAVIVYLYKKIKFTVNKNRYS